MSDDARNSAQRVGAAARRFRAICIAFIPDAATLDEAGWREVESIVGRALAARPAAVRRQLALFARLLDLVALGRTRHTLAGLAPSARWALLDSLSKSRLLLVRRGIWGLRTLAFMGYYTRPRAAGDIGYRASTAGWAARSSTTVRP
jgi:hypothetical protein